MEIASIIFPILFWRSPAKWLERVIKELFKWAFDYFFDDPEKTNALWDKRYAAWYGGWLNVIAHRIEELIAHRAAEIADLHCWPEVEEWHPSYSCRDPYDCRDRLYRLFDRFCDYERLARLRAAKLMRESSRSHPLRLGAPRQSTSPAYAVEATLMSLLALCCLHRLCRGRWIACLGTRDGGGSHVRGPP